MLLLDEAGPELVQYCKLLLQSSPSPVTLYQSSCQQHAQTFHVYRLPIVICTNEWFQKDDTSPLAQWARKCSIVYKLGPKEKLYTVD